MSLDEPERSFDLTCACPSCGYKIPASRAAELLHVDGINVRCPKCNLDFPYVTHKPEILPEQGSVWINPSHSARRSGCGVRLYEGLLRCVAYLRL